MAHLTGQDSSTPHAKEERARPGDCHQNRIDRISEQVERKTSLTRSQWALKGMNASAMPPRGHLDSSAKMRSGLTPDRSKKRVVRQCDLVIAIPDQRVAHIVDAIRHRPHTWETAMSDHVSGGASTSLSGLEKESTSTVEGSRTYRKMVVRISTGICACLREELRRVRRALRVMASSCSSASSFDTLEVSRSRFIHS